MTTKRNTKGIPTVMDKYVGRKIRQRRFAVGMSQEKLSHELGITFQQVQKYERGTNRVAAGRLYYLAQALEVPITYFFEGFDTCPDYKIPPALTKQQAEIVRLFPKVSGNVQRSITILMRAAAGVKHG